MPDLLEGGGYVPPSTIKPTSSQPTSSRVNYFFDEDPSQSIGGLISGGVNYSQWTGISSGTGQVVYVQPPSSYEVDYGTIPVSTSPRPEVTADLLKRYLGISDTDARILANYAQSKGWNLTKTLEMFNYALKRVDRIPLVVQLTDLGIYDERILKAYAGGGSSFIRAKDLARLIQQYGITGREFEEWVHKVTTNQAPMDLERYIIQLRASTYSAAQATTLAASTQAPRPASQQVSITLYPPIRTSKLNKLSDDAVMLVIRYFKEKYPNVSYNELQSRIYEASMLGWTVDELDSKMDYLLSKKVEKIGKSGLPIYTTDSLLVRWWKDLPRNSVMFQIINNTFGLSEWEKMTEEERKAHLEKISVEARQKYEETHDPYYLNVSNSAAHAAQTGKPLNIPKFDAPPEPSSDNTLLILLLVLGVVAVIVVLMRR